MNTDRVATSLFVGCDQRGLYVLVKVRLANGTVELTALPSTVALALREKMASIKGPLKDRPEAARRALTDQPEIVEQDWNSPIAANSVGFGSSQDALNVCFDLADGRRLDYAMAHEVGALLLEYLNSCEPHLIDLRTPDSTAKN